MTFYIAFSPLDQSQCQPLLHNIPISKMRGGKGGGGGHIYEWIPPNAPPPLPHPRTICIFPVQWVGGHCVSGGKGGVWREREVWKRLEYQQGSRLQIFLEVIFLEVIFLEHFWTLLIFFASSWLPNQFVEIQACCKSSPKFDLEQSPHSESLNFPLFLKTIKQRFAQILFTFNWFPIIFNQASLPRGEY